jgi:ferredoxin
MIVLSLYIYIYIYERKHKLQGGGCVSVCPTDGVKIARVRRIENNGMRDSSNEKRLDFCIFLINNK